MKGSIVLMGLGMLLQLGCATTPDTGASTTDAREEELVGANRTVWDGVFTNQQASRGQQLVRANCVACHMETEWSGSAFLRGWSPHPLDQLYQTIRTTMPLNAPGWLMEEEYLAIMAYMLRLAGAPAGQEELTGEGDGMVRILVTERNIEGG